MKLLGAAGWLELEGADDGGWMGTSGGERLDFDLGFTLDREADGGGLTLLTRLSSSEILANALETGLLGTTIVKGEKKSSSQNIN